MQTRPASPSGQSGEIPTSRHWPVCAQNCGDCIDEKIHSSTWFTGTDGIPPAKLAMILLPLVDSKIVSDASILRDVTLAMSSLMEGRDEGLDMLASELSVRRAMLRFRSRCEAPGRFVPSGQTSSGQLLAAVSALAVDQAKADLQAQNNFGEEISADLVQATSTDPAKPDRPDAKRSTKILKRRGMKRALEAQACDLFVAAYKAEDAPQVAAELSALYHSEQPIPLTVKTLAWHARKSEDFLQWRDPIIEKAVTLAAGFTDGAIALAFYELHWLHLAYSDENKLWYEFNGCRWVRLGSSYASLGRCVLELRSWIDSFQAKLGQSIQDNTCGTSPNLETALKLHTSLMTLATMLQSVSIVRKMIEAATALFKIPNFSNLLDARGELLGLMDGVIEVDDRQAWIRESKPEDYTTKAIKIKRLSELNESHPSVVQYRRYLEQVHRSPAIRDFFRRQLASFLEAGNNYKKFAVWTGDTNASKSIVVKILQRALGDYCIDFSTGMVTGKRGATEAPSPQLAQAKGARLAIMVEPDDNERINAGPLKALTGGDRFFARFLHQNGGSVENTIKALMVCNGVPPVPNADKAVVDRMLVAPFNSSWVDHAPESEEEQMRLGVFQKDPLFDKKVPELAKGMLWQMIQDFAAYRTLGLAVPPEVTERTALYWSQTDIYKIFFETCTKTDEDPESYVTPQMLFTAFKEYFAENCPCVKPPTMQAFRLRVESAWGKPAKNRWFGRRLTCAFL